ncbi:MAG: hypothetical protein M1830_009746 [Pleopsidium flavum]|nr:MAG: hypothetical protein M1830_009746 [Pleopsidium flavum]
MGRRNRKPDTASGSKQPNPTEEKEEVEAILPREDPSRYHDDDDEEEEETSIATEPRGDPVVRAARRMPIDDDDDDEASFDPRAPRPDIGEDDTSSATEDSGDLRSAMFNPSTSRRVLAMQPRQSFTIEAGMVQQQMIAPRPQINPLAATTGLQQGQSEEERQDAYAKMMRHFQLDDPKTGPVTREDFNEYKKWAEGQIRKANCLTLEAASAQWHQARELEKEKTLRQEAEEKTASRQVVSREELSDWTRADHGDVRRPTFQEDDEDRRNAERGQFLYRNHSYRIKELRITALLLRARVAVERRQFTSALQFASEAQQLALPFDFPPLIARCLFWRGRAEAGIGSLQTASELFQQASDCEGIYREGKEAREWLRKKEVTERRPASSMMAQRLRTRSKRESFTGARENPPEFEYEEDDFDDGEENDDTKDDDSDGGRDQNQGEIDPTMQDIEKSKSVESAPIPTVPANKPRSENRGSIDQKGKGKERSKDSRNKGKEISKDF